jgi:hypothetical protein
LNGRGLILNGERSHPEVGWDSAFVCPNLMHTVEKRKKQCLRAWDKSSFKNGYNLAKSQHANTECSQCGGLDSIFHMCLRCQHTEIRDLRAKAFDAQATVLTEILRNALPWKRDLFAALKNMSWSGDGMAPEETEHLLRGFLSDDIHTCVGTTRTVNLRGRALRS